MATWCAATSGMDAHHVQFNVVTADTLREAQADPAEPPRPDRPGGRLLRTTSATSAPELQDEIIERTEQQTF